MWNKSSWKLALLTGILVGLSYPPLKIGFLVYFGFIPLLHIFLTASPKKALKSAFIASITANFISLYWIGLNSGAGLLPVLASLIGAVFYLSIFWVGVGTIVAYMETKYSRGIIILPFVWVTMEFFRSIGSLGFPWINLAITQTQFLPIIQSADYFGTYGISFFIILINIGIYLSLRPTRKLQYLLITIIIYIIIFNYGLFRIGTFKYPESEYLKVAVTQPNINPDEKWDPESREANFELMHMLLDSALSKSPNLVMWPESAVPAYLRLSVNRREPIVNKLMDSKIPLISGTVDRTIDHNGNKKYFNSSIFFNINGGFKIYNKIHLVPFAEYIPLSQSFPALLKLNFGQANFTPGTEYTVFNLGKYKFSNVICYESSMPQLIRKFVLNGAQFITIQANDGWLGSSSGPYQHFELAKLRAVENRVPVVRCANTGISGLINPIGKVVAKVPLGKEKIIVASVFPADEITFYTKYGDVFAIFCIFITVIIIFSGWIKRS